jgi:tetratricopeptide (TPR) repeat protein
MRFRFLQIALLLLGVRPLSAQANPEPFALPLHKGAMLLDLTDFEITQTSAKAGGEELGIRAHDANHTELLAFLFLTPENANQTAQSCRKADLDQVVKDASKTAVNVQPNPTGRDTELVGTALVTHSNGFVSLYEYFGKADQCVVIQAYPDKGAKLDQTVADALLARQHYDPAYQPTSNDKFVYAMMLVKTNRQSAAAPIFSDFLRSVPLTEDTLDMRRVATDIVGIDLGMSGQIEEARKLFNQAIKSDPEYPLNYYNLACADAEQGKAADAKLHLQQAFARKANTLPGEHLPDPTADDSIQKLKNNKEFWAFVQSLSKD